MGWLYTGQKDSSCSDTFCTTSKSAPNILLQTKSLYSAQIMIRLIILLSVTNRFIHLLYCPEAFIYHFALSIQMKWMLRNFSIS